MLNLYHQYDITPPKLYLTGFSNNNVFYEIIIQKIIIIEKYFMTSVCHH